jgi:hypothetical protein
MPEVTIQYKNRKTLSLLKDLSKYFDFAIQDSIAFEDKEESISGVALILPNEDVDISNLKKIFSSKNLNANQIRREAWLRA